MTVPPQGPPPGWPPPQGPPQWGPPQQGPQWGPPRQGPPQQGPPQWGAPPPPHWPPPQGQPWAPPTAPRPPSKNTGLIIGLVAAAVVVVVVVVLGVVIVGSGSDGVSDEQRAANATTATDASDFDVVCGEGSVSNAAAYREPYTIVAFRQSTGMFGDDTWTGVTLEGSYAAEDENWSAINAVACVTRVAGTEVRSGTCEFDDGEVADHYAVEYEINVHEAKSGRAVENLGTVNGPATDCPFMATVESDDPRIYGSPDAAAVDAKLAEFAAG